MWWYVFAATLAWYVRGWIVAAVRDVRYLTKIITAHFRHNIDFTNPLHYHVSALNDPIILVHGSSGNQYEWLESEQYLMKWFASHPIYAFTLDLEFDKERGTQPHITNTQIIRKIVSAADWTIEQYAATLHDRVMWVQSKHGGKKVILVGHSMGGLISSYYECLHPERVQCVVSFSTPFQGVPALNNPLVAWWNSTKRHEQMKPGSEFLNFLELSTTKVKSKYLTFGSTHDVQVPGHVAYFNAVDYIVDYYGHFSIVACPMCWQIMADWLKKFEKRAE